MWKDLQNDTGRKIMMIQIDSKHDDNTLNTVEILLIASGVTVILTASTAIVIMYRRRRVTKTENVYEPKRLEPTSLIQRMRRAFETSQEQECTQRTQGNGIQTASKTKGLVEGHSHATPVDSISTLGVDHVTLNASVRGATVQHRGVAAKKLMLATVTVLTLVTVAQTACMFLPRAMMTIYLPRELLRNETVSVEIYFKKRTYSRVEADQLTHNDSVKVFGMGT
ncbi:uncharacterized protein LOC106177383 [Lingula anatina]|uniref:Uncharacterized protein LOC106177383 n=1 Tax=Lingula anatina TaxID=7574 RepID=A0A1S3JYY2_LINAN|nr:uncharacterized protein LOC106177383 [Lingula anatina]|eukprot:XP_013415593.1 uncharacterized protein LOC106177383 [Lingula anatina]